MSGAPALRAGLMSFPLDDGLVVFSEEAQSLIGLNPSATFIFREFEDGASGPDIARSISGGGASPAQAAEWVTGTLEALSSHGLLEGSSLPAEQLNHDKTAESDLRRSRHAAQMSPPAAFLPVDEKHYRLLGTTAVIRFGHPAQIRLVDAVFGHLAASPVADPHLRFDLPARVIADRMLRTDIFLNGEAFDYVPRVSHLAPVIKSLLWNAAVNARDFLFYIHAGVVGASGGCVLLPAAAGSGKSSLTTALVHGGYSYFSDEVALIDRYTFTIPPVPLATCVKESGWEIMEKYQPGIMSVPIHWRADNKLVRYFPPPRERMARTPAKATHIIFPQYRKDGRTNLLPVPRYDALGRLMGECLAMRQRLDKEAVQSVVDWIAAIDCYALEFSSLDEAVACIQEAADPPRRP